MNYFLFCIVFWICILHTPSSFSIFGQRSREYFLSWQEKRSCFWKEPLSSRVTWAMHCRCCILQKIVIFFVFVIVGHWLLLYTNDQFRSSCSGTVTLDFIASFLAFKYSTGTFLHLIICYHFPEKAVPYSLKFIEFTGS